MRYRELIETVFLLSSAWIVASWASLSAETNRRLLLTVVVVLAVFKTGYYFAETLWHLVRATAHNLAYYRFLLLISYNMAQITASFALDFYLLHCIDNTSFSGIDAQLTGGALLFECFYFSVLNFSFFGYGDITPAHIPAKFVMLLEVVTAFSTVIFLLSDFESMKESMRRGTLDKKKQNQEIQPSTDTPK